MVWIKAQSKTSPSYLIVFSILSFTRYSIYPWILVYLHSKKYDSWIQVSITFGLIISVMNFGTMVGSIISNKLQKVSNAFYAFSLLCLASSYIINLFVSRLFINLICYWTMSMYASILSSFSINLERNTPYTSIFRASNSSVVDPNSNIERSLICFIFSTLIAGYLYDNRADVDFPSYSLALIITFSCCAILIYYAFLTYIINKKNKANFKAGSYPSSLNLNYNENNSNNNTANDEETYTGLVPVNFLNVCSGNIDKAQKMYGKMLAWRRTYCVDDIFEISQEGFHDILQHYPHGIFGYSLDGCAVVYEILGKGNPSGLRSTGLTIDHLVWHFNLRNEMCFRKLLDPAKLSEAVKTAVPGAITPSEFPHKLSSTDGASDVAIPRMMTVIDVGGIGITSLTTDVIGFIQKSGEMIDNYYPEQVSRLVICNAPMWFSSIWGVIAKVLPEAVKKKVDILYDMKGLDKYIHPSQRPVEYGGSTGLRLVEGEGHKMFLQFAENWKTSNNPMTIAKVLEDAKRGVRRAGNTPQTAVETSDKKLTPSTSSSSRDATALNSSSSSKLSNKTNTTGRSATALQGSSKSSGLIGWLKEKFKTTSTTAYLGAKNSYKYNAATGLWELDVLEHEQNQREQQHEQDAEDSDQDFFDANDNSEAKTTKSMENKSSKSTANNLDDKDFSQNNANTLTSRSLSNMNFTDNTANSNLKKTSLQRSKSTSNTKSLNKKKLNENQLEEHGLVLAIQAAHLAARYAKQSGKSKHSSQQLSLSSHESNSQLQNFLPSIKSSASTGAIILDHLHEESSDGHGYPAALLESGHSSEELAFLAGGPAGPTSGSARSGGAGSSSQSNQQPAIPRSKYSSQIFLIVAFIFTAMSAIQSLIITVLPVYLASPLRRGGLGYGAKDLALVFSCAAMLVLHAQIFLSQRIEFVLKASPVRSLRIACAVLFVVLLALPIYIRGYSEPIEDVLHHTSISDAGHEHDVHLSHYVDVSIASLRTQEAQQQQIANMLLSQPGTAAITAAAISSPGTMTAAARNLDYILQTTAHNGIASSNNQHHDILLLLQISHVLPSLSLSAVIVPAVLIAALICALYLSKKAVDMLLHLSLSSTFNSPTTIRKAISTASDVFGPFLSTLFYSIIYAQKLRYPMDSCFFLPLSACVVLLVYMTSTVLVVQFRGDYGVMSDYQEVQGLLRPANNESTLATWKRWRESSSNLASQSADNTSGLNSASNNSVNRGSSNNLTLSPKGPIKSSNSSSQLFNRTNKQDSVNNFANYESESELSTSDFDIEGNNSSISRYNHVNSHQEDHLLSIPLGDLQLLFSSLGQGYGSKLHNLKDDFKDL